MPALAACLAVTTEPASGAADLVVTLSSLPGPVTRGERIVYSILVSNRGPELATGVRVTNELSVEMDLVSLNVSQGQAQLLGAVTPRLDFASGNGPRSVEAADLDRDGRPELLVANRGNGTVAVLRNVSARGVPTLPAFAARFELAAGNEPYHAAAGDLDGDGWLDVAVADFGGGLSVLRHLGRAGPISAASFAGRVNFVAGGAARHLAVGDLDGDGRADIAVANSGNASVSVFRSVGSPGGFTTASLAPKVDFAVGDSPFAVVIGDVDGDERPELIVANNSSGSISVLRNTSAPGGLGPASFAPRVDFGLGGPVFGMALQDLDADGKPDLVVANVGRGAASFLRNTSEPGSIGLASMAAPFHLPTGRAAFGASVGDVDADGRPDVMIANLDANTLSVLRNVHSNGPLTAASFAAKTDLPTGVRPLAVLARDLDLDGRLESAVINDGNNNVSVFLHRGANAIRGITFSFGDLPAGGAASALIGARPEVFGFLTNAASVGGAMADPAPDDNRAAFIVRVAPLDFGDAPAPYPTLAAADGARHFLLAGPRLGAGADGENDAQPNSLASGDDLSGDNDEDGVLFATALQPGAPATVLVITPTNGWLNGWLDFNSNGSWADAGEQIFNARPLAPGSNVLAFDVPAAAGPPGGATFARFRFSSQPALGWTGAAPDGEVEDYLVVLGGAATFDFGDAPDGPYPTRLGSGGARHRLVPGVLLGAGVDGESDGQPTALATGDDGAGFAPGDEDGVRFLTPLAAGELALVEVVASTNGMLSAWMDFDANGMWTDAEEQIFADAALVAGTNRLTFTVPPAANVTATFARFRFSLRGLLGADGPAPDGEVEDYRVAVQGVADVTVGTAVSPVVAGVGDELLLLVRVENRGPSPAEGVTVFDTLPAGAPLISANVGAGSFTVGGGPFAAASLSARVDFGAGDRAQAVALADLDGDDRSDLIVANHGANTISVLRHAGVRGSIQTGSFAAEVDFAVGDKPDAVAVADLDGDQRPELVVVNNGANSLSVLRNTASAGAFTGGSLAPRVDFSTDDKPTSIATGDLDGDGRPDLAVANSGSGSVSVLRRAGADGVINADSFAARVNFAVGSGARAVALADVDGDGKLDVATANDGARTISLLRNTSAAGAINAGSFAARVDFAAADGPFALALGDLDRDGKPDLAVAHRGAGSVSLWRNAAAAGILNPGSLDARVDFAVGRNPISVALADMDGDGKSELVVASEDGSELVVLRNVSVVGDIDSSSFAVALRFATAGRPHGLAVGDIDADGLPDVAVAQPDGNTVGVWRNQTSPAGMRWHLGTLPVGGTAEATLILQGLAPGLLTNLVAVNSLTFDPNPNDNTASVTARVALFRPPRVTARRLAGDRVILSWPTQTGASYVTEFTDSLAVPAWNELERVAGTGATATITNLITGPTRFFRLRLP